MSLKSVQKLLFACFCLGLSVKSVAQSPACNTRVCLLQTCDQNFAQQDFEKAHSCYEAVLELDARDDETRAKLARMDAWGGRWSAAQRRYAEVLTRHPEDAEVRAGLVDVFLWQRRYEEAQTELDVGLRLNPDAVPLLVRQARLFLWQGEVAKAIAVADRAERIAPSDAEVRIVRDRMFHGEMRLGGQADFFPSGYSDLYASTLGITQFWRRFTLTAATALVQRYGGQTGEPVTESLNQFGMAYPLGVGWLLGLELGWVPDATALPRVSARLTGTAPVTGWLSAVGAYSYWNYSDGKEVHIVQPSLTVSLQENVALDLNWWIAHVRASLGTDPQTERVSDTVHSVGTRLRWRSLPKLDLGLEYVYGVQLDQSPALFQFLQLRSHIGSVFANWLISRSYGVRPLYRFERRANENQTNVVPIHTLESSFYFRW